MSLFRYPGGKTKLVGKIIDKLTEMSDGMKEFDYREPFFGAGAIGFKFLEKHHEGPAWINDYDPSIYCIWINVKNYSHELKSKIKKFKITPESFYENKRFLKGYAANIEEFRKTIKEEGVAFSLDVALRKIAIHQTSFSGLGTRAGSPIGGREQLGKYKVNCRYNVASMTKNVDKLHNVLKRDNEVRVTCRDYSDLVEKPGKCLIYLDPPYFDQGQNLYEHGFSLEQHKRLAELLRATDQPWVLSYDDDKAGEVRKLYDWADVGVIENVNTIKVRPGVKKATRVHELLITSPR